MEWNITGECFVASFSENSVNQVTTNVLLSFESGHFQVGGTKISINNQSFIQVESC